MTMKTSPLWHLALAACLTATLVTCAPLRGATTTSIIGEEEVRIPRGFEALERAYTRGVVREVDTELVDCAEVPEPDVPKQVPAWAVGTVADLRVQGYEEVADKNNGKKVNAFVHGQDIVLKKCSERSLAAVVLRAKASTRDPDPRWDVYFDCTRGVNHKIGITKELVFGEGTKWVYGSWRLLAVHRNVVFKARKTRIMKVLSRAQVLVYGITFHKGELNHPTPLAEGEQIPHGGWSGAAILVQLESALIAYRCNFIGNKANGYYARYGGGGAIKGETKSSIMVWGCHFKGNAAAVGGAIATSSARVLYVRKSSFKGNAAFGGVDGSHTKEVGRDKPQILVRGGAIRADSVEAHELGRDESAPDEHVLICNSEFIGNRIIFSMAALRNKFHYRKSELDHVRAAGAAVTLWNSPHNLELESGDQHFLTMKGCKFVGNKELIKPLDAEERLGRYVFEVQGAGHCKMSDCVFSDNNVVRAVAKLDNSARFDDGMTYQIAMNNVKFFGNGRAYNLEFEARKHDSVCSFRAVSGLGDGNGDCQDRAVAAIKSGGNGSVILGDGYDGEEGGGIIIDETPTLSPTPTSAPGSTATPTSAPTTTSTPMPTATPKSTLEPTATPTSTPMPTATPTPAPSTSLPLQATATPAA